jgi:hypothetical protein
MKPSSRCAVFPDAGLRVSQAGGGNRRREINAIERPIG